MEEKRKMIKGYLNDLFSSFFYSDRKEDEDFTREDVDRLIKDGTITKKFMMDEIEKILNECGLNKE